MIPIIAGIVTSLIQGGLPSVAQAVIEKGKEYVEDKLGVELKPEMSSEELYKIKERAIQHEEFKILEGFKDTASARQMQIEASRQDDAFTKRFLPLFTILLVILAATYIGFVTFSPVPTETLRVVDGIVEFIKVTFATIVGFWYGSSHGSLLKNNSLLKNEK
jgi:hypothetical protein